MGGLVGSWGCNVGDLVGQAPLFGLLLDFRLGPESSGRAIVVAEAVSDPDITFIPNNAWT